MYKSYQLKACFLLIVTLSVGSLLLMRFADTKTSTIWQSLTYLASTSSYFLICWMIQAYFRQNPIIGVGERSRVVITFIIATAIALPFNYLVAIAIPQKYLFPEMRYQMTYPDFFKRFIGSFFVNLICYAVYNNLFTNNILQKTQLENEQFKQAHLRAQLLALQQQLSPHFLFNSLSTLKTLATDNDTKKYVVQLSHVYRYLLNINERQVTSIADELTFVNAYLYILHQRFDTSLEVSVNVPEKYKACPIPPLSVQLLIENAVKHNALSPEEPLKVNIHINRHEQLVIQNSRRPKKVQVESTGRGLQNINERFQLLFNRSIEIAQTIETFTVTLPITKHESNHN